VNREITIRDFVTSDRDAVNHVATAAWHQYANVFQQFDRLAAFLADTASLSATCDLIVAQRNGTVVGVVGYSGPQRPRQKFFPPEWAVVRMLSVLPAERGGGLGRLLTQACIDRARRDRVATIGLHTSPAMPAALGLYLRMGFALCQTLPEMRGVPYALYTRHLTDD
jgi:ribosomal protein S18 acetylase RimI-like enzyme